MRYLLLMSVTILAACHSSKKISDSHQETTSYTLPANTKYTPNLKGKWLLQSIEGKFSEKQISEAGSSTIYINIDEKVSGFAGCNSIVNGSYFVQKDSISFSNLSTTKKMCIGESMNIEREFLNALRNCNRFEIHSGIASLFKDKVKLAVLRPEK